MKRYRNATQWGVYDVGVEDGRIVDVQGVHEDPEPSDIGQVLIEVSSTKLVSSDLLSAKAG